MNLWMRKDTVMKKLKAQFDNFDVEMAIADAVASGVEIVTVKANKIPKGTYYPNIASDSSEESGRKAYKTGTSGFSMAYPKNDLLSKFSQHKSIGHY
jgi:hypothetical protein